MAHFFKIICFIIYVYVCIYLSIYLSIYLHTYLSICVCIYGVGYEYLHTVMCNHLVNRSCLSLCTPPQLSLCCHIILPPIHLCCVHIEKSIPFISSTIVYHINFIYTERTCGSREKFCGDDTTVRLNVTFWALQRRIVLTLSWRSYLSWKS